MKKIKLFLFLICFFVSFSSLAQSFSDVPKGSVSKLILSDPARPFPNLVFGREYGVKTPLSDYKGQLVFLNFWATWCPPCVAELPSIDKLASELQDYQFRVVAVSNDHDLDMQGVKKFLSVNDLTNLKPYLDVYNDFERVPQARGLPTTIVIDPDGYEIARFEGDTDWASPEALEYFRAMKMFYFPKDN